MLFVDFLRYNFGRIKVILTVVEREYTLDITRPICFAYQLTGFYMIRGFTERYFATLEQQGSIYNFRDFRKLSLKNGVII